jgi:serine/threonine-protein phosphatase 4 regulatory subunit 1
LYTLLRQTDDHIDIRLETLKQLPTLLEYWKEQLLDPGELLDKTEHILEGVIKEPTPDSLKKVSEGLLALTSYVDTEERGNMILSPALKIANIDDNDELKAMGIHLIGKLSKCLNSILCEKVSLPLIHSLADNPNVEIRSAVAYALSMMSNVSSEQFTNRVFPIFKKLCADKMAVVRAACAENIIPIAQSCNIEQRKSELWPIYTKYFKDKDERVKKAALSVLPEIIVHCSKDNLGQLILSQYLVMPKYQDSSNELAYKCAFYFPGVLITLGPTSWDALSKLYSSLASHSDLKVRKCIAHSIHEVANALGFEIAESQLLPIFEDLMADSKVVRYVACRNIANFSHVMRQDLRTSLLPYIIKLKQNKDWRIREIVASQLEQFAYSLDPEILYNELWHIGISLCLDEVSIVREKAAPGTGLMALNIMQSKPHYADKIVSEIKQFAISSSYFERKTFINMCINIAHDPLFLQSFAEEICNLCCDSVVNVRVSVANLVKKIFQMGETPQFWKHLRERLQLDVDDDVRSLVQGRHDLERGLPQTRKRHKLELTPPIRRIISSDDFDEVIEFDSPTLPKMHYISEYQELNMNGFIEIKPAQSQL